MNHVREIPIVPGGLVEMKDRLQSFTYDVQALSRNLQHALTQFSPLWTSCKTPPDNNRDVLVWHRVRPYCRFYTATIGFWNSAEWRNHESNWNHQIIYQPTLWRDFDAPPDHQTRPPHDPTPL